MPTTMWRSWTILGALVTVGFALAWRAGGAPKVSEAISTSAHLLLTVLPNLVLGFLLAGFLQVLLPRETISGWMGQDAGLRGLLVGSAAGALTPGGPFSHFPIVASLLAKGAGVGPIIAYISGWSLIGINRALVWEWPLLGARIALARFLVSLAMPPLLGWLGALVYRLLRTP